MRGRKFFEVVDWKYDELVLAADLVSRNNWTGVRAGSSEARGLSQVLREGHLHPGVTLPPDFRSAGSIQRKSFDLATAAPGYRGKPTRGAKLDRVVIAEFLDDTARMQAWADTVRRALSSALVVDEWVTEQDMPADEGGVVEYLGRKRERDLGLRRQKIAKVLGAGGAVVCEVCSFDFERFYGDRGQGYIEVHHRVPLHVSGPVKSTVDDLALLCANCHRMCHRNGWIAPETLVGLVDAASGEARASPRPTPSALSS